MVDPTSRSELLRTWAIEAGFDRAGIATLEPIETGASYLAWVERGDQASMAWLASRREVRLEPERIFPGARSVVCVALRYAPLSEQEPEGDLWPRVARYARGVDYHDLFMTRLRELGDRIEAAFPGCRTRSYVDTGPVLERALAARAGLGAVGKNTLLLDRRIGSYFLLGEVFTTLELVPNEPAADVCGRCTRCLDACPTGALPEPYRLDANRCISFWTIEHRGTFPPEVRALVGDWVFGCDLCQEACPHNGRPEPAGEVAFQLPEPRRELDLAGLLRLDRERYVELFRGSPMKRAKLAGLKRNAAAAMGNRGEERYRPALEAARDDETEDPMVREQAAWALERIQGC